MNINQIINFHRNDNVKMSSQLQEDSKNSQTSNTYFVQLQNSKHPENNQYDQHTLTSFQKQEYDSLVLQNPNFIMQ